MNGNLPVAVPLFLPVEQREERAARGVRVLRDEGPRLVADRHEGHAWRPAEALLRSGDEQVQLPLLRTQLHAPERGDAVHDRHHAARPADRAQLADGVQRAGRGLGVDDGDELHLRMRVEVGRHDRRVDGLVVRDLDLAQVGTDGGQPVPEALAEDARHQVEAGHPGSDRRARGRLEPKHGLALHEDDLVGRRPVDRGDPRLRGSEALDERRVVVVEDRGAEGGVGGRRHVIRPGAQREVSGAHRRLLSCRRPSSLRGRRAVGRSRRPSRP